MNQLKKTINKEYWLKKLSGELPELSLPTMGNVKNLEERHMMTFKSDIPGHIFKKLRKIAKNSDSALFILFLSGLNIALHKYTGIRDLIVATVTPENDGNKNNIIFCRNQISNHITVKKLIFRTKEVVLQAINHAEYSFDDVYEELQVNNDGDSLNIFNVTFIYEPFQKKNEFLDRFDLVFILSRCDDKLTLQVEYPGGDYSRFVVRAFGRNLVTALDRMMENSDQKVSSLDIAAPAEKKRLLDDFNATEAEYPKDKTLHCLFAEQAEKTPDKTAVIGMGPGAWNTTLTYRELNEKSNQLARKLKEKPVQPDSITGIMVERSVEMMIGIWGILKAGGAYLPIDPEYPEERIQYMLKDSSAKILLTSQEITTLSSPQAFNNIPKGASSHLHLSPAPGTSLAYVTYTSGSTGKPKGVIIEHQSVVNFIKGITDIIPFGENDCILSLTTITFDIFGLETLLPLIAGSKVVIGNKQEQLSAVDAGRVIERENITIFQTTPSRLQLFTTDAEALNILKPLKYLLVGGEALPAPLLEKARKLTDGKIYNLYGPTETTIWSTVKEVTGNKPLNIGKPIANTRIYILDANKNIQPIGVLGELYISGAGISRGYLNRPQLTRKAFIDHPFIAGEKLYRTGDLARWLPNGNIEFSGRIDHQVKVRGYRIELGEIENQLLKHQAVKDTVVTIKDVKGDKYLCAYIVFHSSHPAGTPNISGLQEHLSGTLPGYMLPSFFVPLEKIPLTANGKVDRKALPKPELKASPGYTPPRNIIEEKLSEIWSSVLGLEKETFGIDTDFFHLGGHSLKATVLISRVHREFNVKLSLARVFKTPTIREIGEYIEGASKEQYASIEPVKEKEYYELSSAQKRMYILDQMGGNTAYNMPGALKIAGPLSRDRFEETILALIKRHESLRTSFRMRKGESVQIIDKNPHFIIDYYDLKDGGKEDEIVKNFIRPFDLSQAPLFRVGLIKLAPKEHLLLFDMHHIISDGFSMVILTREFVQLYTGNKLPQLRVQYKDFSEWQNNFFKTPLFMQQEKYWQESLKGKLPQLQMPTDFVRPVGQTFAGNSIPFTISREMAEKLDSFAKEKNLTLNILFLSLYFLLLYKNTNQEDIIIGSLVSGRNHVELENIIGMFGNFLPIRCKIEPASTFSEFLISAGKTILEAYDNQDYPFERIIDLLNFPVDLSRNPLFDTMLIFHNEADMAMRLEIDELKFTGYPLVNRTAALDFKIDIYMGEKGDLNCVLEYNVGLFKKETMEDFTRHFQLLIAEAIEKPHQEISGLEIFTKKEKLTLSQKRKRNIVSSHKPFPMVISATFTPDPVRDHIKWWGKQFGLDIDVVFAPYNQVFQELLDENSLTSTNGDGGVNLLLIRFEDWIRDLDIVDERKCEKLESNFKNLIKIFKDKQKAVPYFVGIFPPAAHLSFSPMLMDYLEDMYSRLGKILEEIDNVYVIDFTRLRELYVVEEIFDPLTDREGHLPFSTAFYAAMGAAIARKTCALNGNPFKVIVLDCDNTLWQGICGEDGPLGVSADSHYRELQRFMIQKYNQGFLLAICSKNNEADVWEVFEKNPGMLLKKEHFVNWKINWQAKSENIKTLARELNLGIDSFIFLDDSPVECSEVMTHCPEVLTLPLPRNPGSIPRFLNHVWAFDKIKVTDEDRMRTRMYRAEQKRKESEKVSLTLNDFLANLQLKISMNVMKPSQVSRVSQLTLRTNQFNLSTIRRKEDEIMNLAKKTDTTCWVIEVSDRFGDYGLVGVVITKEKKESLFIDTLLLSCRVLGRGVEEAILKGLRKYSQARQLKVLEAYYYPTPKNTPLLAFLQNKWIQQKDQGEYSTYIYPLENCSESAEFADFYYQESFKKEMPRETVEKEEILPDHRSKQPARLPGIPGDWTMGMDLTNTGKLRHKNQLLPLENHTAEMLLGLPTYRVDDTIAPREKYEPPRDKMEKKLVEIWQKILRVEPIGVNETFFRLGGNSLKAITVISEIHKRFQIELSLREIFENKTIRQLAQLVANSGGHIDAPIELVEEKDYYPLSSAQKRLYFLQQLDKDSTGYNELQVMLLEGDLDYRKLEAAFNCLIERHECLRTSIEIIDKEPIQRINKGVKLAVEYYESKEDNARQLIRQFVRPFELSIAPFLRIGLIKTGVKRHMLMIDMHHLVTDGVSHVIFAREMMALYGEKGLSPLPLQYKDYSEWLNSKKQQEAIKRQEEYWQGQFEGEIPVLNLPYDYQRPAIQSLEGRTITFAMDKETTRALKRLALEENVTLYMLLLAIYIIFLSKLSGQEDIVVGSPVAGRRYNELNYLIGIFINMIGLRNFPIPHKTFKEFLAELKDNTLTAFENQECQFEDLIDQLALSRDISRNPLFDVTFALQNLDVQLGMIPEVEMPELRLKHYNYKSDVSKFDLYLNTVDTGDQLIFILGYCTKLFKDETIRRFIGYFNQVCSAVHCEPRVHLGDIDILAVKEKNRLLFELNNTREGYPADKTLHQLFHQQAEKTPHRIAICIEDEQSGEEILNYKELNESSNRLARVLKRNGVGPDRIVGILMERSINMIIGLLGILKAGGAYLPLDPGYSDERLGYMLEDAQASLLLTGTREIKNHSFTALQRLRFIKNMPHVTAPRSQIRDFDALSIPDRSFINYEKYNRFIGLAMVKNTISLQSTRGCPYNCAYCHKIWPKNHVVRSAENIFAEVKLYYDMGVRRFVIVDDIFNLNRENSSRFFRLIIENGLQVQLYFPNGVRGDILTKDYIDLMVKAGTTSLAFALETASTRLQKLIRKNLNLKKFKENIEYFSRAYPHVILELFAMHGFPGETEEEAYLTLDFIKSLKWIHFPYFHILKIYPNTDMEKLALENGISSEAILTSENLAYHELPGTLPFDKSFTLKCQADFLNEYFLSKERLLAVLPHQLKVLTEDELVQKYNSYLPAEIHHFNDLLQFAGIDRKELGTVDFLAEEAIRVPGINEKIKAHFPVTAPEPGALRVLLMDLSQFFTHESHMLYDVVETPLGLMNIMTCLKQEFGPRVNGKIAKSRIDFDNNAQLKALLEEFKPDIIGLRTLTYYKDFLHRTAALIRQWGLEIPIIAGGPYATSDYRGILQDRNIDVVVLGEGELTFNQFIGKMLEYGGRIPTHDVLKNIPGIAYRPSYHPREKHIHRHPVLIMDELEDNLTAVSPGDLEPVNQPHDLAYIIYTSGTTGKPKGVMIEHENVVRLMINDKPLFDFDENDVWTMFHSYNFDFSVWEMYGALLFGGKLVIVPKMAAMDAARFRELLKTQEVTILNQTPSAFYNLVQEELKSGYQGDLLDIKTVIFGGEALKPVKLKEWKEKYPEVKLVNMFGITETTVHVTYKEIGNREIQLNISSIGIPIPTLTTYVMDSRLNLVPFGIGGELLVGGKGPGRGYLNRPGLTAQRFIANPYNPGEWLYKSGDLVKMQENGEMEYLGRLDHQVKIRGYRVELAEIESQLLKHGSIKEVVVLAGYTRDLPYLCAYITAAKSMNVSELREYLLRTLPDYMIPSYFVQLPGIPLNSNGKVDRKRLPDPRVKADEDHVAPRDDIEEKLVQIWAEELQVDKQVIGIDANFFELGGHSLNATIVVSKVHRDLQVKVPLAELFINPTIRKLAEYIRKSRKDKHVAVKPVEKKEYYPLSSAQKRLYILQEIDADAVVYNLPEVIILEEEVDRKKLEETFRQLIKRHESIRTSFDILDGEPIQRVHDKVEFEIEYYQSASKASNQEDNGTYMGTIIQKFKRPFDFRRAPLLRVGLVNSTDSTCTLLLDTHHIITDNVSRIILGKEFMWLYRGNQLPPIRFQYKDYSEWQRHQVKEEAFKKQEKYWIQEFQGKIPSLNLPTDYLRPSILSFEGREIGFEIGKGQIIALNEIAQSEGGTLFMVLFAIYNILLSKICNQEDIVVGTDVAGRNHADLGNIIGIFVNTLPIRNFPTAGMTFKKFLREVKEKTIKAFENQDYQFEDLVAKVWKNRDANRHPIFDVMFSFIDNSDVNAAEIMRTHRINSNWNPKANKHENKTAKFDLLLHAIKREQHLSLSFEYCTRLFKEKTIKKFIRYFKEIAAAVIKNETIQLGDISISHSLLSAKVDTPQIEFGF